jgi:hypothetical protein
MANVIGDVDEGDASPQEKRTEDQETRRVEDLLIS